MKENLMIVKESLSINVGKFLLERGFELALGVGGRPIKGLADLADMDSLGVLHKDPQIKAKWWGLFGLIKPKRVFLGKIEFKHFNENEVGMWHFNASGKKYQTIAQNLTDEMSKIFKVKIVFKLITEYPLFESFWRHECCD
jgi:hypothetical protein